METVRSYGPLVRLWLGPVLVVVLTDPNGIEKVVKHDKLCRRGYLAKKLAEPLFRNGLICKDGEIWRRHHKIVSSAVHVNILETFVGNFAKNSDILSNKLKVLADSITAHDISTYFNRCTLDIIYQTTSRIDINTQTGNDNSTLNNFTTILDVIAVTELKTWLTIEWIFKASELGKKYYKDYKIELDKIINETGLTKRMREIADK